jgi:hypothetical protein
MPRPRDELSTEDRHALWTTFADFFLDGETRVEVPHAARLIIDCGLSFQQADRIWRYEVTPALFWNTFSIAGQWGAWNEASLIERIEKVRKRIHNRPPLGTLLYPARSLVVRADWKAVQRCVAHFEASSFDAEKRLCAATRLTRLARLFFDDGAVLDDGFESHEVADYRELFESTFLDIFTPLIISGGAFEESLEICTQRVVDRLNSPKTED